MHFVKLNSRSPKYVSNVTKEARDILSDWLWADSMLYNHFLQRHRQSVWKFGSQKMIKEVGRLRSINLDLVSACSETSLEKIQKADKIFKPSVKRVEGVILKSSEKGCTPFYMKEVAYTKRIRLLNKLIIDGIKPS